MRVFDAKCNHCDSVDEVFTKDPSFMGRPCPHCDTGTQSRVLSAPRFELEGITGDFPGAANKWAERHIKGASQSHKRNLDRKVHEVNIGERTYV